MPQVLQLDKRGEGVRVRFGEAARPGEVGRPSFGEVAAPGEVGRPSFSEVARPGEVGRLSFSEVARLGEVGRLSFGEAARLGEVGRLFNEQLIGELHQAHTELDAFAERMNVNPSISVEVAVHSDARDGADAAKIDQRRADAIVEYLASKGVKRDRMMAKGYGFAKLKNHCALGVACSEEEHAENRRVEYTVTAIKQQ